MHPFGKEESASLDHLFWFFCKCVQRGDWELAQACVPQLHQRQEEGHEKVEAILQAIIACPSHLRYGSNRSPQKLAWFWLLVLQKWLAWEQKTVPVSLQREVEFLLLLEELEKDVSHAVLKELYEVFENRHGLNRKQRDGSAQTLSVEAISELRKMLLPNPRKLQAVLEFLWKDPAECGHSPTHSCSPQTIFIGFLWDSLKLLKRLQLNPVLSELSQGETVEEIYRALSMLNLEVEKQTGELHLLCRELLDACWAEQSPLREERLLSCMLRKNSHALLSLFGSVFVEKTREKLLGPKSPGKGLSEQLEAEQAVMALFSDHEHTYSWKAAYFYCLSSNKHFLEQILVTALTLLKKEDFSSLSNLLKQEFSCLSRLLVLLGWTQCRSLESAKTLLWTLHKSQGLCNDTVLKDFCNGLCAQVEVLEWCIQRNSNIPEKVLLQHLHSLDCHSSLYLLHHLTNLLALNEEAVIELLQKIPAKDMEAQDSTMLPASSLLSQRRNLVLFQAFCAMKYAIYALCVNAHKNANCKDCMSSSASYLHDELPEQNKPADLPVCPDYSGLFAQYLVKCQQFLRMVPIPLRLELLENIFSLLFVSYGDLCNDDLVEENTGDDLERKNGVARNLERCASQGSSTSTSPLHSAGPKRRPEEHPAAMSQEHPGIQTLLDLESNGKNSDSFRLNYLDLKHFTSNSSGFLVDDTAMELLLKLLLDNLKEIEGSFPWDLKHVPCEELALLDCLNLSVNRDSFSCRMQLLSKYLSEASWRHKIVTSNRNTGSQRAPTRIYSNSTRGSNLRRHTRTQRQNPDCKKGASDRLLESTSSELSTTSTSEGSNSMLSDWSDVEYRIKPQQDSLIPMMLSPPESLLVSCILRGNFVEAHQVAIMFNLETSAPYGELIFLERYQEVIRELAKVEHKIDAQSSEGSGSLKRSGNGRSTLQAIGNAAAAGMVFYSISDVTDKLLAPSEGLVPMLQEGFRASTIQLEPTDPLNDVLEGLCASAMATFDLATAQCRLWKTCKHLLESADRRLQNSLEARGRRLDPIVLCSYGMRGFPAVLQEISKIINTSQGQPKSEISDEKISQHFHCSISDLLQTCYPALTENCITNHIVLTQHFEQILNKLEHAEGSLDIKGNVLTSLVEQSSLKPADLEAHPVSNQVKLLLRTLDQHAQTMQDSHRQTAYVQDFFGYIKRLAATVLQSLNPELDQSADVQVGNPFILLQQSPSQLLSQLLFERQVAPDRLSLLLAKEELNLNVQQVIINCCCKALPLYNNRQGSQVRSFVTNISSLAHLHAYHCLPDVEIPVHNPAMDSEDASSQPALAEPNQHMLTTSSLAFLKSQSKLTATVACLSASKVQKIPKQSLSWMEFRGKREVPLSIEQISKECEVLLKEFPLLESFLLNMCEPLQDPQDEGNVSASGLCGKSYISLLFLGLHSITAVEVLMETFEHALSAGDWPRALKVLDLYSQDMEELVTVRDAVLSCATAYGNEGWRFLFPVRDAMLRSRLALRCLDNWPLEACLEILAYCASDPEVSEELRSDLQGKVKELGVYQKILNLQDVPVWHNWQDLKRACSDDPQAIVGTILEAKDYELCEEWGNLYPVPRDNLINLHQEHLLHLLALGDTEKALQLLQRIEDPDIQLVITEQCLDKHPSLAASHFLADYLTTHFYKHLTVMRHNEIQALYMGSKVLLTLPEPYRVNYSHLSCKPLLMLEQLLMNMKVDWAAVAIETLHQLLVGQEIGFTVEDVDALLSRYAGKALDFPFSLKEKRSDSMSQIQESLYRACESDTLSKSESTDLSPTSIPGEGKKSDDTTHSSSLRERSLQQTVSPQEFVPPEKPPPKQQWIPDETEVTCMVCKTERFTMFNRRHHCRRCGRLVCSSCSAKKMVVEACRENPARVCDQCYSYCNKECSTILSQDTEAAKEEDQEQEEAETSDNECSDYFAVVQIPRMAELEWLLSFREEENEIVRREFYYEQAPSASLCIAIFSLHSDSIACGHQLIEHCCKLSRGLTNPEVDAGLLTDIMRQLLFSAKMMFVKTGRSQDLALCDSFISKVDVLNLLVAAAYRHVPSLDQILQPAAVTRLRNQLLEAEYYQLAVEVSTKTGLDPGGAWHAWGMACLKAGNLTAAREKFSRCLKPPLDLNQLNLGSRLVQDVIQYLESTVKPILSVQDDDYFATLRELETILRTHSLSLELIPEGKIQHNSYYQECLFYLHNYGTNLAIISFFMRHGCLREALLHLLNKESPQEVFIEGIFVPSYKSGKLHMLENLLESIDPGLESWGVYLIAACKHLQKKNYYHILYELQQFMKDQVRAAMTCIRFFTHKAKSYTELGDRKKWLLKVKDHLKIYLQEVSRSSGRKKVTCTFRKKMSAPDVSRHINTVELQMEVTNFLHRCEKLVASPAAVLSVPTLFGNNQMKMEVVCKVMLEGKNIEEGFGIAFRVLQDFQLETVAVYNRVARQLVKQQNYTEIRQLLKCIKESGAAAKNDGDNVILNCLDEFDVIPSEELDNLIQDMESDENKIQAYLRCHKLRSAYLVSVKQENTRAIQLVQHVRQLAEDSGEDVVQAICTQWLSVHHTKPRSWLTQSAKK
ncbi:zinc finger FYVE domain-containing protein 26 isoform X2 [Hemicordylus capensis]|uniref:zinc finger FYVE domain-containing protein 26 isoform X2 n=1 Tax=Hemicordylus capensis TaxID=884348 RepID=UPI0023044EC3|nr:zinc finger FYVE domain-containing protein 26 isoform X2 [Hemicordylus capensis]